jgi:hypothetical protein
MMAFRTQRYKSIFWYAILMCAVYSLMAYTILNKLSSAKQESNKSVDMPAPFLIPELQQRVNVSSMELEPPEVEDLPLSRLEAIEAEKSALEKLESIKKEENMLKKSEVLVDTSNTYKPTFKSNSTHLWNMRVADAKYSQLAKQLTCRTVEYDIGLPSADKIDSCIESSANEFSIENTIEAQKWIFNHQNPSDCSNKKYAIIKNIAWSGFSSSMHLIAWAFAKALTLNRIAVYDAPANWVNFFFCSCKIDCFVL